MMYIMKLQIPPYTFYAEKNSMRLPLDYKGFKDKYVKGRGARLR